MKKLAVLFMVGSLVISGATASLSTVKAADAKKPAEAKIIEKNMDLKETNKDFFAYPGNTDFRELDKDFFAYPGKGESLKTLSDFLKKDTKLTKAEKKSLTKTYEKFLKARNDIEATYNKMDSITKKITNNWAIEDKLDKLAGKHQSLWDKIYKKATDKELAIDDNIESIFYNIDSIARISKNGGGVGVNVSRIRAKGSMVNGYYNASGGVVPWIRIINDTAVAVNQQGRRAGAATVALDTWHLDIESFLELQTENGDQRGKAYDIYPQVVCSNLFMKRVKNNESWTLLDPYEIRRKYGVELCELYGYEFESIYEKLEKDDNIKLKKV